ncbi:MAG: 50S ribosomal protein L22 [Candidatus Komeilibacteria bacterium]
METVKTTVKYLRLSPSKTRLVIGPLRGLKLSVALDNLKFQIKKPSLAVAKLLETAKANAVHNHNLGEDSLIVKEIVADAGPVLKRWMPKAHGRADMIRKPMTHITVTLAGKIVKGAKKDITKKTEATIEPGQEDKQAVQSLDKNSQKVNKGRIGKTKHNNKSRISKQQPARAKQILSKTKGDK